MKRLVLLGLIVLFIGCPSAPKNAAKIYVERGDYQLAKEQILVGLKDTPNDFELYCLLAKAEIGLFNWVDASKAFRDAIKIDSAQTINWILKDKKNISVYWQAFYNAAVKLQGAKQYETALKNLAICELIDPTNVSQYILHGGIYSQLGEASLASKAYNRALAKDPENPEAHFLIGEAFFDSKSYDSALVKLNDAIKYYELRYSRISKIIFQNLPEIDKLLVQKIVKLWDEKKNVELDELVKVKLGFDGGLNAHKRNIEKFFKTTHGFAQAYYLLGMTHYYLKNHDNALSNVLKSLDLMPDDLMALFYAGEMLMLSGKYREAKEYFEKVTQLKEDDIGAWFYIGSCYLQLKEYKKAISIYEEKVLPLNPKFIDAMTNLASAYREIGNNKKSFEYLMRAKELQKEQ